MCACRNITTVTVIHWPSWSIAVPDSDWLRDLKIFSSLPQLEALLAKKLLTERCEMGCLISVKPSFPICIELS